jgi:hypothetical protein
MAREDTAGDRRGPSVDIEVSDAMRAAGLRAYSQESHQSPAILVATIYKVMEQARRLAADERKDSGSRTPRW